MYAWRNFRIYFHDIKYRPISKIGDLRFCENGYVVGESIFFFYDNGEIIYFLLVVYNYANNHFAYVFEEVHVCFIE